MMAEARASRCFRPRGRVRVKSWRRSSSPTRFSTSVIRAVSRAGVQAVDAAEKGEVFLPGQVLIEGKTLGHVTDVVFDLGVFPDDVEAPHPALAAGGQQQPVEHADGGGFARPVGPQEAENLPPVDLKADVVHRLEIPEMRGRDF